MSVELDPETCCPTCHEADPSLCECEAVEFGPGRHVFCPLMLRDASTGAGFVDDECARLRAVAQLARAGL